MAFLASSIIHSNLFWHGRYILALEEKPFWPIDIVFAKNWYYLIPFGAQFWYWNIKPGFHQINQRLLALIGLHWPLLILFLLFVTFWSSNKYKHKNSKLKNFEGFLMTVNEVAFSDLSVAFLWSLIVFQVISEAFVEKKVEFYEKN